MVADARQNGNIVERAYNVSHPTRVPVEPVNAAALYKKDGSLEIWAGTQDGLGSLAFCGREAGIRLNKVTFHLLPRSGPSGVACRANGTS